MWFGDGADEDYVLNLSRCFEDDNKPMREKYQGNTSTRPFECRIDFARMHVLGTEGIILCSDWRGVESTHAHTFDTVTGRWRSEILEADFDLPHLEEQLNIISFRGKLLLFAHDTPVLSGAVTSSLRTIAIVRDKNGKRSLKTLANRRILFDNLDSLLPWPSFHVVAGQPLTALSYFRESAGVYPTKIFVSDNWVAGDWDNCTSDEPIRMRVVWITRLYPLMDGGFDSVLSPTGKLFILSVRSFGSRQALVIDTKKPGEWVQSIARDPRYGCPVTRPHSSIDCLAFSDCYDSSTWRLSFGSCAHGMETATWQRILPQEDELTKKEYAFFQISIDDERRRIFAMGRSLDKSEWTVVTAWFQPPTLAELAMKSLRRTLDKATLWRISTNTRTEHVGGHPYEAVVRAIAIGPPPEIDIIKAQLADLIDSRDRIMGIIRSFERAIERVHRRIRDIVELLQQLSAGESDDSVPMDVNE